MEVCGYIKPPTTNQQAEIIAAVEALKALPAGTDVTLYSDSQYVVKTMNGEFKKKANKYLWLCLEAEADKHNVEWVWVRGHDGNEGNSTAHDLAEKGRLMIS